MDDEIFHQLRKMVAEMRPFSRFAGDDLTRILDGMDTILDGAPARSHQKGNLPATPYASDFLSQIPEWAVIYNNDVAHEVVWCNAALLKHFGKTLEEILAEKLRRTDVIDEVRSHYSKAQRADAYILRHDDSEIWGKAHTFTFSYANAQYIGDLTFNLDHYYGSEMDDDVLIRADPQPTQVADHQNGLLDAALEYIPLAAAIKKPDGTLVWCNWKFLSLVKQLSPKGVFFPRREDIYGKTSAQVFWLDAGQSKRIAHLESIVADKLQPVIAHDSIHDDDKRLALRFPIFDAAQALQYIGVVSMPR